ncbi:MAG: glycosyltransferase family 2 protein [Pseudomonadota bacterium]
MAAATEPTQSSPRWSVVLPYYNERDFIAPTIRSILLQESVSLQLILVDNASTDGSEQVARAEVGEDAGAVIFLSEPAPGKSRALETGLAVVETEFVALCDADTIFPRDYLKRAQDLFDENGDNAGGVIAFARAADLSDYWGSAVRRFAARMLRKQCHAGGFGHAFRTEILREAGGASYDRWPFVLLDHEMFHRVVRISDCIYDGGHICFPSRRRKSRKSVRWNLLERLLYNLTPNRLKDWYFYKFLGPRLLKRGLYQGNLRDHPWTASAAGSESR